MIHVTEKDPKKPNVTTAHTMYTRDELVAFWDIGPTAPEDSPDWSMIEYMRFGKTREQAILLSALFQRWILADRHAVHWADGKLTFWLMVDKPDSVSTQKYVDSLKERCSRLVAWPNIFLTAGAFVDDYDYVDEIFPGGTNETLS